MKKRGLYSIEFDNVYLKSTSTVVGPLEAEGPLKGYFDKHYEDNYCGEDSWEKAEMRLLKDAIEIAIKKGNLIPSEVNLMVGGDLNNQIAITNYVMRDYSIPFLGVYAACSTCTESLLIGAMIVDNGYFDNVLCCSSSHNATSERQFRYPTEYGGQKPDSLTLTTTASGAGILANNYDENKISLKLTKATVGIVVDGGITDAQDMGRAMAPAAALTLKHHLEDFNIKCNEYDLIVTGDLSTYGSLVFEEIISKWNIQMNNHQDAGLMIFDKEKQEVFAGGSGCGCISAVLYGYLVNEFYRKKLNKVLVIATGALLNPVMIAQKESIPSIAHAIVIERGDL